MFERLVHLNLACYGLYFLKLQRIVIAVPLAIRFVPRIIQVHNQPVSRCKQMKKSIFSAFKHPLQGPKIVVNNLQSRVLRRICRKDYCFTLRANPCFFLEVNFCFPDCFFKCSSSYFASASKNNAILLGSMQTCFKESFDKVVVNIIK